MALVAPEGRVVWEVIDVPVSPGASHVGDWVKVADVNELRLAWESKSSPSSSAAGLTYIRVDWSNDAATVSVQEQFNGQLGTLRVRATQARFSIYNGHSTASLTDYHLSVYGAPY